MGSPASRCGCPAWCTKPVVLPTEVDLHTARTAAGWALTLRGTDRDRVHLVMSVTAGDTG